MDNERISLRLDVEDLELIDDFVGKHPEFSNRSHLARIALRHFIEKDAANVIKPSKDRSAVKIPGAILAIIERMVEDGYYSSVDAAIEEAVREHFLSKPKMDELKATTFEDGRKAIARM